jgi:hypothetical protein
MEEHHDDIVPLFPLMTLCDENKRPLVLLGQTEECADSS